MTYPNSDLDEFHRDLLRSVAKAYAIPAHMLLEDYRRTTELRDHLEANPHLDPCADFSEPKKLKGDSDSESDPI